MHTLRNIGVVKGGEKLSQASTRRAAKSRRAISPVIATIILIAITIVIAVAVAGWVFGLFGSYSRTNPVTIIAASSSCTAAPAPGTCKILLSNQGSSAVGVVSASINGVSASGFSPTSATVSAGSTLLVTVTPSSTLTSGQTVTVQIGLSNGNTLTTTLVVS